jgi:hypothetical protein
VSYRQGTRLLNSAGLAQCNAPVETARAATGPDVHRTAADASGCRRRAARRTVPGSALSAFAQAS